MPTDTDVMLKVNENTDMLMMLSLCRLTWAQTMFTFVETIYTFFLAFAFVVVVVVAISVHDSQWGDLQV
jgi:hypothetical protein